jgi:hypothetical protein
VKGLVQQQQQLQPGLLRLQVLVTGSLYVVGDCFVGLQQQPQ